MDAYSYYQELDARLEKEANEANAIPMKKYMKNHFEFYGIKSVQRKRILASFRQDFGMIAVEELEEFVRLCWDNPFREVHYSCLEIIEKEKKPNIERLELYEWMVVNRSWWDSVDFIAPTLMGRLFHQNPDLIPKNTWRYIQAGMMTSLKNPELWLQRSALIFQLKYKADVDLALLFNYCEMLAEHKEFFIRKAIGWSLRQAGKSFPNEVIDFVQKTELSKLSKREALKHLS